MFDERMIVANRFPAVPDGTHVGGLAYFFSASQLSDTSGQRAVSLQAATVLGSPTEGEVQVFDVGFDTGITDGVLTYDASGFDQDAFEAELTTLLDAWCAYAAVALGVTLEQAQAAVKVTRCWFVELDARVLGETTMYTSIYDTMAYPAAG